MTLQITLPVYTEIEGLMHPLQLREDEYAVVSLKSGNDVKTVQENLGHAIAAFPLDVYGHATEKMRKDSADRMQALIKSVC